MRSPSSQLLSRLSARQDIILVALLVATVAMMILPLPTVVADMLIALNIGISIVLMMVAVYIRAPVELSTLPSIILITTAFRLSLSITTSRMVLVQADAGEIIRTFGEFVIAGNVVVGLVVYLIITIVQFVVITKGSERVAEVAARFTLDSLPGRQMSIDTDLKSGDIDGKEAKRRRNLLQKESQLYGAMDGAMKFVKGDAIASLIIIIVNLIGGISIGCLQRGMSFSDATHTYSLLAVGDGLIAQIPALLISLTAGVVVTRVTSEENSNLGRDIVGQLASDPRTLAVAGLVLGAMALVPGFPSAVFLFFSFVLLGTAWLVAARRKRDTAVSFQAEIAEQAARPVSVAVVLHLGRDLSVLRTELEATLGSMREALSTRLGIPIPPVRIAAMPLPAERDGDDNTFRIDVDGVPFQNGALDPLSAFVEEVPNALRELGVELRRGPGPFGDNTLVVSGPEAARVQEAGLTVISPAQYLSRSGESGLMSHARRLVGVQEAQSLLRQTEAHFPELVREATRICPVLIVTDILRQLVEDQVSVANMRQILDTLLEWSGREQGTAELAAHVRVALRRQICHQWSSGGKVLNVVVAEPALEQALRPRIPPNIKGNLLEGPAARQLVAATRQQMLPCLAHARPVLFLVSPDLRRHMRKLLRQNDLDVPVLTYEEVAPEFSLQVLGTLPLSCIAGTRPELVQPEPGSNVKPMVA